MYSVYHIRENELGLLFRRGTFRSVLAPGRHVVFGLSRTVQVYDTLRPRFEHDLLNVLVRKPQIREHLLVLELGDTQRAMLSKDGRVFTLLGPGLHAFWRDAGAWSVDLFDVAPETLRVVHPKLSTLLQLPESARFVDGVWVGEAEVALLFLDGKLVDRLGQGLHVFWKGLGRVTWKAVDLREQVADVAGQEIITADKVTLRVNLVVTYVVTDAVRAVTTSVDHTQALYREAQLALRAAVGTKALDTLLSDKESVGQEVRASLAERATELGLGVKSVGLRDIILPGDMKLLLNQVIAATKEAEANLIRRREETAAARSQANTAKLLSESPALLRLKEFEVLKDVLSGSNATFVLGQGDLTDQLRTLVATK